MTWGKRKKRLPAGFDRHHRKPRASNGNGKERNISIVPIEHHRAYHKLFGKGDPHRIVEVLNSTWIDPDFILIVKRRDVP